MAALGVGPSIVALDADDQAARQLIGATGLHATNPAFRVMTAERLAKMIAAGRPDGPVLTGGPESAHMAASVAATPAPNRNGRRRRLAHRNPSVGRNRLTRCRNQ